MQYFTMAYCHTRLSCVGLLVAICFTLCHCRVLELDERFEEISKSGDWLVMFYAPWCGHCKQLEPIWMAVGDAVANRMPVYVARLDCTRFSGLAGKYKVRGFPTIKFISGEAEHEYRGARTKDDIIAFVEKARRSKVTKLNDIGEVRATRKKHDVFFLYLGDEFTPLHRLYDGIAQRLFLTLNFYEARSSAWPIVERTPAVLVFKDYQYFQMPQSSESNAVKISHWMTQEQLSDFAELNTISFHKFRALNKPLVVAVLPEKKSKEFKAKVEEVALSRDVLFHPNFAFCWVKGNDLINELTFHTVTSPNVVVLNLQSYDYYPLRSDGAATLINKAELNKFLTDITEGKLTAIRGSGFIVGVKRSVYSSVLFFINFFRETPVMASLIIGVPTFVITSLCYCVCTMEDTGEEEDEEDSDYDEEDEAEKLPEYEAEGSGVRRRKIEEGNKAGDEGTGEPSKSSETEKDK